MLSQLQAQQHGMSINDLQTAEQRLGDQRQMIANSWQRSQEIGVAADQSSRPVDAQFNSRQRGEGRHRLATGLPVHRAEQGHLRPRPVAAERVSGEGRVQVAAVR